MKPGFVQLAVSREIAADGAVGVSDGAEEVSDGAVEMSEAALASQPTDTAAASMAGVDGDAIQGSGTLLTEGADANDALSVDSAIRYHPCTDGSPNVDNRPPVIVQYFVGML